MANVIAFINEKGGVGKSSICFNTGWCFAEQGKKVLFIDLDGQRANLTYIAGIDKPTGLSTIYDVLTDDLDVKKTVLVVEDNLHIIPATADVVFLDTKNNRLEDMQEAIGSLRSYYDYIFIDVSPTPNRGHALALAAADSVIVPMLPDITSLEANKGVVETIRLMQKSANPNLRVLGIILNKFTLRTLLSNQVAATASKMAAAMNSRVFKTKIRQGVAMSENVGQHTGVTAYAPKSKSADDIRQFCKEIEEVIKNG